uniref:Uncharacterized protein n=1 Tax=Tanacetum cinerariifolium TaxID=118510 RepID=A0A699UWU9_TANCI|nr:hypothetical protein [Tanacetum cinerariifolium]
MSSKLFVSDRMLSRDGVSFLLATLFETSLASLEVSEESFKQAVGTGELTVGMGDSIVNVSICSAKGLNVEAVELGFPLPSGT